MSRSAAIWAAVALTAVLLVFAGVSLITSEAAWFLWSVVPIVAVLTFFLAAIRGERLGEQKRARDIRMAERKAAERKARTAPRPAD
jgi:fatty acid desaturase